MQYHKKKFKMILNNTTDSVFLSVLNYGGRDGNFLAGVIVLRAGFSSFASGAKQNFLMRKKHTH
jgi:hypothetical protein